LFCGATSELEEVLLHSEDSSTLNTSFVERHNLTIRQGSAYLGRCTPGHARHSRYLIGQMALMMIYYNRVRPHMALKFGKLVRTPAMQARLVTKRLSFREMFTAFFLLFFVAAVPRNYGLDFRQSRQGFLKE